jgi:hypothetical protein
MEQPIGSTHIPTSFHTLLSAVQSIRFITFVHFSYFFLVFRSHFYFLRVSSRQAFQIPAISAIIALSNPDHLISIESAHILSSQSNNSQFPISLLSSLNFRNSILIFHFTKLIFPSFSRPSNGHIVTDWFK